MTKEQKQKLYLAYGRSLKQAEEIRSLTQQVEGLMKLHPEQPSPQERTCETCSNQSFNETHGCINYNQWFACKNWQPKPQEYISGIDAPGRDASWGAIVRAKCSAPARSLGNGKCVYISAMTGVDAKIDDIDFEGYWSYHNAVLPSDEQLSKFVPKPQEATINEKEIVEKAEQYWKDHAAYSGTVFLNPVQVMSGFALSMKEGWQREAWGAARELTQEAVLRRGSLQQVEKYDEFDDWNRDKNGKREGV